MIGYRVFILLLFTLNSFAFAANDRLEFPIFQNGLPIGSPPADVITRFNRMQELDRERLRRGISYGGKLSQEERDFIRAREGLVGLDDEEIAWFYQNNLTNFIYRQKFLLYQAYAAWTLNQYLKNHDKKATQDEIKWLQRILVNLDHIYYRDTTFEMPDWHFSQQELGAILSVHEMWLPMRESFQSNFLRADREPLVRALLRQGFPSDPFFPSKPEDLADKVMFDLTYPGSETMLAAGRCCKAYLRGPERGCLRCPLNVFLRRKANNAAHESGEAREGKVLMPAPPPTLGLYKKE